MSDDKLTPELIEFVKQQKDRQEIYDCLLRYTRGIDRHDKELMLSAYHPDAFDEHGFCNDVAEKFCDWAIGFHSQIQTNHHHIITNHTVELDGDTAHAETYYSFWGENKEGPPLLAFGRYIDRFEKRDGKWGIAYRVCITDKTGFFEEAPPPDEIPADARPTGTEPLGPPGPLLPAAPDGQRRRGGRLRTEAERPVRRPGARPRARCGGCAGARRSRTPRSAERAGCPRPPRRPDSSASGT